MDSLMTKPALVTDNLVLRTATVEAEIDQLRQALNQGHYLKAGRPAGHVLWQGIYRTDDETDYPQLVYGLICGAQDVKAIWQKCGPLDQKQRRAIGQPLAQRTYSGKKDDCELPVAQRLLAPETRHAHGGGGGGGVGILRSVPLQQGVQA
jgi:hypothetical protein